MRRSGNVKKKQTAEESKGISRSPPIERIIAIAQTLASICFSGRNYERQIPYQTFEYLSSFRLLEELRLIKRISSSTDCFSRIRFDCLAEKKMIEKIAEDLNIALKDFLMENMNYS